MQTHDKISSHSICFSLNLPSFPSCSPWAFPFLGFLSFIVVFFTGNIGPAADSELLTNSSRFSNPPKWLSSTRVNRIADQVQSYLEWSIRRVEVIWFQDQNAFQKAHGLNGMVLAVSKKSENRVLLGPKVTSENFDQIFAHELSHVISYQKYKEAIPKWLEEGLANFIAKNGTVDYKWLSKQSFPVKVEDLVHPFSGNEDRVRYHYQASQALAEMLNRKCDFKNLLRLSVGKGMDQYLKTFCGIKDLNSTFQQWVKSKAL